ncbi:MAG: hypothetical protein ACE5KE_14610 [Methanosarcinales archaeon]
MNQEKFRIEIDKFNRENIIGLDEVDLVISFVDKNGIKRRIKCPETSPLIFLNSIKILFKQGQCSIHRVMTLSYNYPEIVLKLSSKDRLYIAIKPPSIQLSDFPSLNKKNINNLRKILRMLVDYLENLTENYNLKKDSALTKSFYIKEINRILSTETIEPLEIIGDLMFVPNTFEGYITPEEYIITMEKLAYDYFNGIKHSNIKNTEIYKIYLENLLFGKEWLKNNTK